MQAKLLRNDALCCATQEAGALARLGKRGALIRLVAFVCVRGDTLCPRSLRVRTAWSQGGKTTSLRACLQTYSVSDEAARVRLALAHSYKKATRVLMSCLQGARAWALVVLKKPPRARLELTQEYALYPHSVQQDAPYQSTRRSRMGQACAFGQHGGA